MYSPFFIAITTNDKIKHNPIRFTSKYNNPKPLQNLKHYIQTHPIKAHQLESLHIEFVREIS
jgi:hypothetical protein